MHNVCHELTSTCSLSSVVSTHAHQPANDNDDNSDGDNEDNDNEDNDNDDNGLTVILVWLHIVNLQCRASVGQLQIMSQKLSKMAVTAALGTSPWHSPIIPERRCSATCISALQLVNMAKPPSNFLASTRR